MDGNGDYISLDPQDWFDDARYELEGTCDIYSLGRYRFVVEHCQRSIELGMIALGMKKDVTMKDAFDLRSFGRRLNVPEGILSRCETIMDLRMGTRFRPSGSDVTIDAAEALAAAIGLFTWIEKQLSAAPEEFG